MNDINNTDRPRGQLAAMATNADCESTESSDHAAVPAGIERVENEDPFSAWVAGDGVFDGMEFILKIPAIGSRRRISSFWRERNSQGEETRTKSIPFREAVHKSIRNGLVPLRQRPDGSKNSRNENVIKPCHRELRSMNFPAVPNAELQPPRLWERSNSRPGAGPAQFPASRLRAQDTSSLCT